MILQVIFLGLILWYYRENSDSELPFKEWLYNIPAIVWIYNGLIFLNLLLYAVLNMTFLEIIFSDYERRNKVLNMLTELLNVDRETKDVSILSLGTLNILHPPSLLSWLEMRSMVVDLGKRF